MENQENPDPSAESTKVTTPPKEESVTPAQTAGEAPPPDASLAKQAPKPAAAAAPPARAAATTPPAPPPAREVPAGTPPAARLAGGAAKTTSTPTATVTKGVAKPVAAKAAGAVVESTTDPPVNKMRRRIVWASIGGFLAASFLMFLRFFLPRAIFEPSSVFRVGFPGDYALGVDTKYQQQYRIWVDKTSDRLFVIYARCTHLGCTPDWKESENKFKCPCHGSGYDSEGVNFEGPAPRPMDRAHVELDPEGQIVVDINRLYKWPKGEPSEFDKPGSFIPL